MCAFTRKGVRKQPRLLHLGRNSGNMVCRWLILISELESEQATHSRARIDMVHGFTSRTSQAEVPDLLHLGKAQWLGVSQPRVHCVASHS